MDAAKRRIVSQITMTTPSLAPRSVVRKHATTKPKTTPKPPAGYQSVNPYDGKTLKTFKELTAAQLETAIQTAAECFGTWRQKTFAERAVVVAQAAALLRARVDEFARPVTLE